MSGKLQRSALTLLLDFDGKPENSRLSGTPDIQSIIRAIGNEASCGLEAKWSFE
jgi:hypothetical protein